MNSYTNRAQLLEEQRHQLEALLARSEYTTAYHPKRLAHLFARVGNSAVNWLTSGTTPRISKQVLGGVEIWKVYDPATNQTFRFDQEEEVRIWLDERYYR